MKDYRLGDTSWYQIEEVYQRVDDGLVAEIVALWRRNGIEWPLQQAENRARQAVCVARDNDGQLFGINSVYAAKQGDDEVLDYRLFVEPKPRNLTAQVDLTARAYDVVKQGLTTASPYKGLRVVLENKRLVNKFAARRLRWAGFEPHGITPQGLLIWYRPF